MELIDITIFFLIGIFGGAWGFYYVATWKPGGLQRKLLLAVSGCCCLLAVVTALYLLAALFLLNGI